MSISWTGDIIASAKYQVPRYDEKEKIRYWRILILRDHDSERTWTILHGPGGVDTGYRDAEARAAWEDATGQPAPQPPITPGNPYQREVARLDQQWIRTVGNE